MYDLQKAFCIPGSIQGQVKDPIHTLKVLLYLESRRGEESKQDLMMQVSGPEFFDDRPALFEFTQGSAMHPDDLFTGGDRFLESFEYFLPPLNPFFSLGIEERSDMCSGPEKPQENIVEKNGQTLGYK